MEIQPNQNPRVVWMMDETIAQTHPKDWEKVTELEKKLVRTIGNTAFNHQVVSPLECLPNMANQLHERNFSCIIDLTGWLTSSLREIFPNTRIVSDFSMSRVRMVSSPTLETTGYVVSMTPEEIATNSQKLNLSRPLVVDDVSFSGWTSRKTMEMWGLNPESTSHAFLIANTGDFGKGKHGAVQMLENLGSRVIFGHGLRTPAEDGWHLKDLHTHQNLESAFTLSLLFQKMVAKNGIASDLVQNFFTHETVIKTIFPNHLSSNQIKKLEKRGRFIVLNDHCLETKAIHARNPFLWASPYFQQHISTDALLDRGELILEFLKELRLLTSDPGATREAGLELRRRVNLQRIDDIKTRFAVGKERL